MDQVFLQGKEISAPLLPCPHPSHCLPQKMAPASQFPALDGLMVGLLSSQHTALPLFPGACCSSSVDLLCALALLSRSYKTREAAP